MNRSTAVFLAVLVSVLIAVAAPIMTLILDQLIPLIGRLTIWEFSAIISAVLCPVFYRIFRTWKN